MYGPFIMKITFKIIIFTLGKFEEFSKSSSWSLTRPVHKRVRMCVCVKSKKKVFKNLEGFFFPINRMLIIYYLVHITLQTKVPASINVFYDLGFTIFPVKIVLTLYFLKTIILSAYDFFVHYSLTSIQIVFN